MNVSVQHPNNRPNFTVVCINGVKLYFSYETLIAFVSPDGNQVISENCWGPTTGRHLSMVGGGVRVSRSEFERLWEITNNRYLIDEGLAA